MEKKKVSFTFWLPEGKTATIKADDYELLLQEIDSSMYLKRMKLTI